MGVAAGTPVLFKIDGANVQVKLATTDASGVASISYVGALTGTDTVTAFGGDPSALISNPGTVTWGAGQHVTFLDLSTSPSGGIAGQSVTVSASLSDVSLTPRAPIANAAIHFVLGAQSCDAVTGANGVAACSITLSATGQLVLSASYAGSSLYTPASAAQGFGVVAPAGATPGAPTIVNATAGNGQITVAFTPPASTGGSPITSYTVACTPVQGGAPVTATGPASPITVFGLTDGVTYACTVSATNGSGAGPVSAASNVVIQANLSAAPIPALGRAAEVPLALLIVLFAGLALRRKRGAAS